MSLITPEPSGRRVRRRPPGAPGPARRPGGSPPPEKAISAQPTQSAVLPSRSRTKPPSTGAVNAGDRPGQREHTLVAAADRGGREVGDGRGVGRRVDHLAERPDQHRHGVEPRRLPASAVSPKPTPRTIVADREHPGPAVTADQLRDEAAGRARSARR